MVIVLIFACIWFKPVQMELPEDEELPARRAMRGESIPLLIKAREFPIQVNSTFELEDIVTDDQLFTVLSASLPLWHPPSVPSLIHELKLWGPECVFTKEMVGSEGRTGKLIVQTLLNDQLCATNTVVLGEGKGGAYLIDSPFGIHPIQSLSYDAVEYRAETHYGKLTMIMALTNMPLSTPVTSSSNRVGTLADVLQDTIMNFHWGQELEFIACSLALWLPPVKSWTNQFGETFTFDELMERLLSIPLGYGCCAGTHVPFAVTVLLQADDQYFILDPKTRIKAIKWLNRVTALLEQTQHVDGSWPRDWGCTNQKGALYNDPVLDCITITGHHLEWIAYSSQYSRPNSECLKKAAQNAVEAVEMLHPIKYRSFKCLLPCSHFAVALCKMKNQNPNEIWMQAWEKKNLIHTSQGYVLKTSLIVGADEESFPRRENAVNIHVDMSE